MQWVTSVSHAQIVENQNIATATPLRWSDLEERIKNYEVLIRYIAISYVD